MRDGLWADERKKSRASLTTDSVRPQKKNRIKKKDTTAKPIPTALHHIIRPRGTSQGWAYIYIGLRTSLGLGRDHNCRLDSRRGNKRKKHKKLRNTKRQKKEAKKKKLKQGKKRNKNRKPQMGKSRGVFGVPRPKIVIPGLVAGHLAWAAR